MTLHVWTSKLQKFRYAQSEEYGDGLPQVKEPIQVCQECCKVK